MCDRRKAVAVPPIRLKHIDRYTDRHGRERLYLRVPGAARVPLPGKQGSPEFMVAYNAAIAGAAPAPAPASRVAAGTIEALVSAYYRSAEFKTLADSTKSSYRNILNKFRSEHGERLFTEMQPAHVRRLVAAKSDTPAAANALLVKLRIILRFAMAEGWLDVDPTLAVKKLKSSGGGFTPWTEEQITAYETRWPIGTPQRLAFALLLYTGQRGRSDVTRMGRQHIQTGRLLVIQQKTKARLAIPIHPRLREVLDTVPPANLTFLVTQAGAPFTGPGFGNWFADQVAAAGVEGVAAHGLRKAAGRRMAEAGCTPHQIAAILGHKTLKEVERYTASADQIVHADAAILKLNSLTGVKG